MNADTTEVVSASGPTFEHRILGSAAEAQDVVQDVWLRWRFTDCSAVPDPRQAEVELSRCQVDGKRPYRRVTAKSRGRKAKVSNGDFSTIMWIPEAWGVVLGNGVPE